jgi:hypothetical protein
LLASEDSLVDSREWNAKEHITVLHIPPFSVFVFWKIYVIIGHLGEIGRVILVWAREVFQGRWH